MYFKLPSANWHKILSRHEGIFPPQFNDLETTGPMLGKFINYQQDDCQDKLTGHLFGWCEKTSVINVWLSKVTPVC